MTSGFFRSPPSPRNSSTGSNPWDSIRFSFPKGKLTPSTTAFLLEMSRTYSTSWVSWEGIDPRRFSSSWTEANLPELFQRLWTWGFVVLGSAYPAAPTLLSVGSRLEFSNLLTGAMDVFDES